MTAPKWMKAAKAGLGFFEALNEAVNGPPELDPAAAPAPASVICNKAHPKAPDARCKLPAQHEGECLHERAKR